MNWPKITGLHIYRAIFLGLIAIWLSEVVTGKFGDAFVSLVQLGLLIFIAPGRAQLEKM